MQVKDNLWALILGGTGGFGFASAKILASRGYNLVLVYRERKSQLSGFEPEVAKLRSLCNLITFNVNANDMENQNAITNSLLKQYKLKGKISFLLHAIADGNLRPLFSTKKFSVESLYADDFQHTVQTMGISLFLWTKLLYNNGLFAKQASVLGLTSEGAMKVFKDYAAVGSAKALMESTVRYMAVELAGKGIRVNLINAGITDTKALQVFPDYEKFILKAKERNPSGRLTTTGDVAKVIAFLASADSVWINGTVITVDGGEQLISLI
jgi:enoyl-[acyl-carrier protein] reductase III